MCKSIVDDCKWFLIGWVYDELNPSLIGRNLTVVSYIPMELLEIRKERQDYCKILMLLHQFLEQSHRTHYAEIVITEKKYYVIPNYVMIFHL